MKRGHSIDESGAVMLGTLARKILAAAAMVTLAAPASAEWMPIGTSSQGSVWMIDFNRIRAVGTITQIWVKVDHSKDASVTYRHSMNLYGVNCVSQSYKLLQATSYDSYDKVVNSQAPSNPSATYDYQPIVPETMMEAIAKVACTDR